EWSGYAGVLPPVHGAWHGALWRRRWPRSPRFDDGDDQLGGKGPGPGLDGREPSRQQPGGAHTAALPIPAGGALLRAGQHRRRGQLPLRRTLRPTIDDYLPARPSVSSMRVPTGSRTNAIFRSRLGISRYGISTVTPAAWAFFTKASRFFTSKPM